MRSILGLSLLTFFLALVACSSSASWSYDTEGEPYAPHLDGGVAYTSAGNYVYAIDATNGKLLWRYGEIYASHGRPTGDGDIVYVGSNLGDGTFLVALDAANGDVLWRSPTDGPMDVPPVTSAGVVYGNSFDGFLYALDARTGTTAWEFAVSAPGWFPAEPVVSGGTVFVTSSTGPVYALEASTGTVRWQYDDIGQVSHPYLVLDEGVLYVAAEDAVHALDINSGELLVQYPAIDLSSEIDVSGGMIYARTEGDTLTAWSMETAAVVWRFDSAPISSPPTAYQGVVYAGSFDGELFELDARTGEILAGYGAGGGYVGDLTVSGDTVYVASGAGRLYAIEPD